MNIVVIGTEPQLQDCVAKFGGQHQCVSVKNWEPGNDNQHLFFIFDYDSVPKELNTGIAIFADTTYRTLTELRSKYFPSIDVPVFGFAGIPGFLNRQIIEVCVSSGTDNATLAETCEKLGTEFQVVADQVGMFTPRVVAMIINEAYFAVEDLTASRDDIDKAMKTGTNYPWGPFEWSRKIGLKNVVLILAALNENDPGGRYQICATLKAESLNESQII